MKQRKPYKTYTREFKQQAVRLTETTDRPATEVAMELGIRRNQLYKWKEQLVVKGDAAFSGRGRPRTENQSELTLLRRDFEQLKEENEILKKAAAYLCPLGALRVRRAFTSI
jgi:transposase